MTSATPSAPTLALHEPRVDLHAVYATDWQHNVYRVTDPLGWKAAQDTWLRCSAAREHGRMPHVKFFEVRSVTDPKYANAPLSLRYRCVATSSRGFARATDAARQAWKLAFPTYRSAWDRQGDDPSAKTGEQGYGGWYYYPNGSPAAQGLSALAPICVRRGMIVQGKADRWYVLDLTADADQPFWA